ncbi:MAG: SDR family oxidoreductase [Planctomycetales bacterium]|nr:SDR family oxidoreductase [Planctomycetales bacterium]
MDLGIAGRTALVTGSAGGIGLATARLFAQEGCCVVMWDVADIVKAAASNLREEGYEVDGFVVDIERPEDIAASLASHYSAGGRLDIVVHCAAIGSGKFGFPFTRLEPGDWKRTLEVNILGMVNIAHATAPYLIEAGGGCYVFLASVAGQIGSPTDPPYSASKAANINFAQCMAKDLAVHGIRVNSVCPGMVKTKLNEAVWQAWHDQAPVEQRRDYETWAAEKIASVIPLGRWQTCENVADAIVFLCSERAQEITGQTINVDGGFVMHW